MKLALGFVVAVCVTAQQPMPHSTERSRAIASAQDSTIDYFDAVSDYFRNTPRAVAAISKKGIPDQEIPAVLLIARRSTASPNQVIDARLAGKSFAEIAKANRVTVSGDDFVKEANIIFLSEYHGRPADQIRSMNAKGANFIDINRNLRREGEPLLKQKTETSTPR